MTPTASAHSRAWRTAGRPGVGVVVLSLAVPGVFMWIDVGVASHTATSVREALLQAPLFGLLAALGGLGASCRIDVSEDSTLRLVNLFFVHEVPSTSIRKIDASAGLQVLTTENNKIGSTAYSESLLGGILNYPRARHIAGRLIDELHLVEAGDSSAPESESPRRRVRWACTPLPLLGWALGYFLVALAAIQTR